MRRPGLRQLLHDAVHESERHAPASNPLAALTRAKRRRERRRGHLVVLAFVLSVAVLQGLPSNAFGSTPTSVVVATGPDRLRVDAHG